MASIPNPDPRVTVEQYLEIERASELRSELIAGKMVARSGATRRHNLITAHLVASLDTQLRNRDCEAYASDMRVNIGTSFFYPDVVVACGEIKLLDGWRDTLLNPRVVVEVLSSSTERYDRGEKFARSSQIPSLNDYVLVSQDHIRVEHFARQPHEKWLLSTYTKPESVLELPSIDCRVTIEEIYRKVDFGAKEDQ